MRIRQAVITDLETLIRFRMAYLREDSGIMTECQEKIIKNQLQAYIPAHLDRDYFAFLAEKEQAVVASAFLVIAERPAGRDLSSGKVGTLLNVFTEPAFRRRGIAKKLLRELLKAAEKLQLSRLDLMATPSAVTLYRSLGFSETENKYTAMQLHLHGAQERCKKVPDTITDEKVPDTITDEEVPDTDEYVS